MILLQGVAEAAVVEGEGIIGIEPDRLIKVGDVEIALG